jgi:type II secretory pathway pseudopilin PulG
MRALLIVVAVLALAGFVAVAFILPQKAISESRNAAQALIEGAASARQTVTGNAEKASSLQDSGAGVKLANRMDPAHGELKWIVEAGGAIRAWNEKNAIEISLTPSLQGGKVTWKCRGYPAAAMPESCGR